MAGATWEIANPVTGEAVAALLRSGVEVSGTITLALPDADLDKVRAVEEAAAEAGIVLVRQREEE